MDKILLTPKEVEALFGISRRTLANWRSIRKGPEFLKLGKKVLYEKATFEEWIRRNTVRMRTHN